MAFVLSNQEDIDLLLFLLKIAISVGAIAIFLLLWFWLRLKKLEKHLYKNYRKQYRKQANYRQSRAIETHKALGSKPKILVAHQPIPQRLSTPTRNFLPSTATTLGYRPKTSANSIKQSHHSSRFHLRSPWVWAIFLAIITGMAIALMQLGNTWISPELLPLMWFLIGFMLIVSATFVKSA